MSSLNLDPNLFSTSPGAGKKTYDPSIVREFRTYWSKDEMTRKAIMAKPEVIIEKRTLKRLAIESMPLTLDSLSAVKKWAVGSKLHGYDGSPTSRYLVLAGGQIARQGDYVVKWPDGRFMAFPKPTWEAMTTLVGFTPKYEDGNV